jgi:two-component system, OmpR family, sensor histidine kinase MprB
VTLRRRLTLLAACSVALAIIAATVGSYIAVRSELRDQVDDTLHEIAGRLGALVQAQGGELNLSEIRDMPAPPPGAIAVGPPGGDNAAFIQLIAASGHTEQLPGGPPIPVSSADQAIADSGEGENLSDATIIGDRFRVLTVPAGDQGAVQIGRSLEGVDDVLANLRVILVILSLAGIGLAALVARLLAQRVLTPIAELTETAEHVVATDDLSRRIEVDRDDEVGRLAARFNEMLAAIEGSQEALTRSLTAQNQLVADASHELRTPIASLRTDVESLRDHSEVPVDERTRRLDEASERVEELTALVNDVIELARGDRPAGEPEDVRLDDVVQASVERLARLAPERPVEARLERSVVEGRPDRIARAVNNLLDNADKYSPSGRPIEVSVRDSEVIVRDHGPGLSDDELEHAFDRFWRGAGSRDTAGSVLGLAIVRQVAKAHGGEATMTNANGGGAEFRLRVG